MKGGKETTVTSSACRRTRLLKFRGNGLVLLCYITVIRAVLLKMQDYMM